MKTCTKCGLTKNIDEFYARSRKCKKCVIRLSTERNKKNREERLETQARYRKKNKDKRIEYNKKNREKIAARRADYYLKNKKMILKAQSDAYKDDRSAKLRNAMKYAEANKEKIIARRKKAVLDIDDKYVIHQIIKSTGLERSTISNELINAWRERILLSRKSLKTEDDMAAIYILDTIKRCIVMEMGVK